MGFTKVAEIAMLISSSMKNSLADYVAGSVGACGDNTVCSNIDAFLPEAEVMVVRLLRVEVVRLLRFGWLPICRFRSLREFSHKRA